jgi:hypothetical protein
MATLAALGKTCARPAIRAALWSQDHFCVRQTQVSWSPKLYFYDHHGKTLAFVREAGFSWSKEVRVFTDPTLSFELLSVKPLPSGRSAASFEIIDSMNHQRVGAIMQLPPARLQRRHWTLLDTEGKEVGAVSKDSLLLAGMRGLFTQLVPQRYTFRIGDREVGEAKHGRRLFSPEMTIDLSRDCNKHLDRRLVTAAILILMTSPLPDLESPV